MKKLIVLFISIFFLFSLACPIVASAAVVNVPLPDANSAYTNYIYNVGTTGGGSVNAVAEDCLIIYLLYLACPDNDGYPSFQYIKELGFSVSLWLYNNAQGSYSWLVAAGNAILNTEPITIPQNVITNINKALEYKEVTWRLKTNIYALKNIESYSMLNVLKFQGKYFYSESEYLEVTKPVETGIKGIISTIKGKLNDLFTTNSDGFQNLDNRFLTSFSTIGNQLYAIRDRISEDMKPISDWLSDIKDGIGNVVRDSWIGQQFSPDSFEDESFSQYDKFVEDLEDERQQLLDDIDSFKFGLSESIQEIGGALLFVSVVFGYFAQIPFIQTVFNFSLALGMTATVLGLVPMVITRMQRNGEKYK